ncbi:MAG TPA: nodulation protein NfeD [Chitinophagaceae bacterium]|nr:nodulation protein NfeD [Chitinophagaceae bacterium]
MIRFLSIVLLLPVVVSAQKVLSVTIDGSINPASASYIERGIKKAEKENAQCLIINLNTPGGLLKSTRVIVGAIMESRVPVVVYVTPPGAHAGSAGVFITMAAHIAAMAPATNIGAAHPVSGNGATMDTTMNRKVTNDAVAFIRTIAEKRNRNAEWAEDAVRNSESVTGIIAVQKNVVDLVATSTQELLKMIDGREIQLSRKTAVLKTAATPVEFVDMTMGEKLMNIFSDPNIAYILLMMGFYGILFELYNPGAIFPGVVGGIALILGLYALNSLPLNYAGLALIVFGIILLILEIKITSYGLLTVGGVASLVLGSLMLIREDPTFPLLKLSLMVIFTTVGLTVLFFLFVLGAGVKALKLKPVTGVEGFIGETGFVMQELNPFGTVHVHGEIWQAESISGTIEKGAEIRVLSEKSFRLKVERV